MRRLKSFFGYTWAVAAIIIAFAAFFGFTYFSHTLAVRSGVVINPRYSGGEVVKDVDHGAYKTSIHRPVFDALIGQTEEGFIQIDWKPAAGLPKVVSESIDYDNDGKEDFIVALNTATGETTLVKRNTGVLDTGESYRLRNGWAIRIPLKRQS